ncbi:hypothetical protein [Streptomyces formicae]|uniref:Uncharacterized protein n=1 Tax=Streptomyces formicae TaxID=1616117 RepID=A0ABY3WKN8_9ACTN|nr:hypothetical protein [Streptomyces formicae]UNM13156.1 hypothetical protein J4032_18130 [Streptomyces formicae]
MVSDVVPQAPDIGRGLGVVFAFIFGHAAWLVGAGVVAVAAWAASAVWWRRRAVRELGGRARFQLVPAVTFDPQLPDVGQAAARLAEARAAAGALPARAAALRIRVSAGEESRLRYAWEGPERAASVLRLPGYRQVEVLAADAARDRVAPVRFEGAAPLERGDAS